MTEDRTKASEEQLLYANILNTGMWIGLAALTVTFLMYAFGALPNFVPIEELPQHWAKKASVSIHELHAPTGWGWLAHLGRAII